LVRFQSILIRGQQRRLLRRLSKHEGSLKKILTSSFWRPVSILTTVKWWMGSKAFLAVDLGRSWPRLSPRLAAQPNQGHSQDE